MQHDDPRLTAYVLGELEPPERAEVEALLHNDPAAAQEVAEMRELAALVRRHLSTEEAPPLAPQQRDDILSELNEPQVIVLPRNQAPVRRSRTWMPVAIAACAAVLAGSSVLYYEEHKPRESFAMDKEALRMAPSGSNAPAEPNLDAHDADEQAEKKAILAPDPTAGAAPMPTAATPLAASSLRSDERSKEDRFERQLAPALRRADESSGKREAAAPTAPFARSAPAPVDAAPAERGLANAAAAEAPAPFAKGAKETAKLQDAPRKQMDRLAVVSGGTVNDTLTPAPSQNATADKAKRQDAKPDPAKAAAPKPEGAPLVFGTVLANESTMKKAAAGALAAKSADKAGLAGNASAGGAAAAPRAATAQPAPDSNGTGGIADREVLRSPLLNKEWGVQAGRITNSGSLASPPSGVTLSGAATANRRLVLNEELSKETRKDGIAPARSRAPASRPEAEQSAKLQVADTERSLLKSKLGVADQKAADDRRDQPTRLGPDVESPTTPVSHPAEPVPADALTTDSYDSVTDNPFLQVLVRGNETSTFSIDVDTASYSNVRRFLNAGQRPPKGAVRIEELVNYFKYDYPEPKAGDPMSVNMDVSGCPWTPEHRLLRVGLKARELDQETRPQMNLIFLLDVSGSMQPEDRLPLIKKSLGLLIEKLGTNDTVGIVVYAGNSGVALEPTNDKDRMLAVIDKLSAGGSTNGGEGIQLAYKLAAKRFKKGAINRVILATDGDFNVGVTNQSDLIELIKKKAESGVFLTILGVGHGNLKDSTMEKLADQGNGNYAYIDTLAEGRKVLVEQMAGTLVTVAKDVKLQIEFNPAQVAAYRLIGYENRLLAKEDFNDDTKDAGELGAGHTVTALYELVPAGQPIPGERETTQVDPLKYQPTPGFAGGNKVAAASVDAPRYHLGSKGSAADLGDTTVPVNELLTLKLRWKAPDGDVSTKREFPLTDAGLPLEKSATDFRWAAAVAEFGMLLRDSPYKGQATWAAVRDLAVQGQGKDADSHRIEFLELIGKAEGLGAGR